MLEMERRSPFSTCVVLGSVFISMLTGVSSWDTSWDASTGEISISYDDANPNSSGNTEFLAGVTSLTWDVTGNLPITYYLFTFPVWMFELSPQQEHDANTSFTGTSGSISQSGLESSQGYTVSWTNTNNQFMSGTATLTTSTPASG